MSLLPVIEANPLSHFLTFLAMKWGSIILLQLMTLYFLMIKGTQSLAVVQDSNNILTCLLRYHAADVVYGIDQQYNWITFIDPNGHEAQMR